MPASQLRLFADPQPLVERLGREFFRQLPDCPGVYLMCGSADMILYIGKAKSLRHRLCSYRVANPERMAQRTLRLLCLVERVTWEECCDEEAALRREAELLRALKPRFNRAGVWQGPKSFLVWRAEAGGLEIAVTERPEDGWQLLGPLGRRAFYLQQALVRLLWCRLRPERGLAGMPSGWFGGGHGERVRIECSGAKMASQSAGRLSAWANGDVEAFKQWLLPPTASFEKQMWEEDMELLAEKALRTTPK